MTLSPRLDEALARLNAALQRLQAAVDQRLESDVAGSDRDREFALLQEDRGRLAAELDAALAQKAALLAAQAEVYHRLDRAGRTVEQVLQHAAGTGRLAAGAGR